MSKTSISHMAVDPVLQITSHCQMGLAQFRVVKFVSDLKLLPVWVNPDHLIESALILLKGHRMRALGVLEGGKLVGTVSAVELAGAPKDGVVGEAMTPAGLFVSPDTPIRQVAQLMYAEDLDHLVVMDGERFCGIVTPTMLLGDLGRTWDPLTGLPWSDHLREWGIERLKEGQEVTILFLDLDDFGQYNKQYGHIVGDRVLQRVAAMLTELIHPTRDLLVRYGGDEFAVGTLRTRQEIDRLADQISSELELMFVSEADEPITASIGVFGGRRSRERENIHFAATLDSLINLASKECMAQKVLKKTAPATPEVSSAVEPDSEPEPVEKRPDIKIVEVQADDRQPHALITVLVSVNGQVMSHAMMRGAGPMVESVAKATAKALERAFPDSSVSVEDVRLTETEGSEKLIAVSGRITYAGREIPISAVKSAGSDLYRAAAEVVADAVRNA